MRMYWRALHFVDALWVFAERLLYLGRRQQAAALPQLTVPLKSFVLASSSSEKPWFSPLAQALTRDMGAILAQPPRLRQKAAEAAGW